MKICESVISSVYFHFFPSLIFLYGLSSSEKFSYIKHEKSTVISVYVLLKFLHIQLNKMSERQLNILTSPNLSDNCCKAAEKKLLQQSSANKTQMNLSSPQDSPIPLWNIFWLNIRDRKTIPVNAYIYGIFAVKNLVRIVPWKPSRNLLNH